MASQLIINKRGTSLSIRNGLFLVRTPEKEQLIPVHQVKSICLHPSTKLTHEVVLTTIAEQIDVLFFDRKGFPVARIWSNKFGSISTIRKNQLEFTKSQEALEWVKSTLAKKCQNQMMLIKLVYEWNTHLEPQANEALGKIQKLRDKLMALEMTDRSEFFASLRGYEGSVGKIYFGYLSEALPEAYRFERRSQRPAKDMFNSLLNYGYGMLYGQVESALIQAGIDPYLGIFHRDEYNRPVLTYDFIERYRVWIDYVVTNLCCQELIQPIFFDQHEGTFWLNAEGKRLLVTAVNDYLAEKVEIQRLVRSRQTHLEWDAQQFASQMKHFQPRTDA